MRRVRGQVRMPDLDGAWTVSHLARTLKRRVEDDGASIWVRGEVTGVKRYASGHCYFSLRDDLARVDCTMWRSSVARLRTPIEEGSVVYALGHASVWEERTALRFNVTQVLPASEVGPAAQEAERVKQLLLRDGLLDPARKRPVPEHATRIAVITSVSGAAVRDIITVAARRWPGVELFVINSSVQGTTAAAELVAALGLLCHLDAIDCCIIGRGGGSKEDLVAFNDEMVCRAIAACSVPVISAVGHEVDVTLADLVADLRAATPSQAAEFALPDRRDVEVRLDRARRRLASVTSALLRERAERVERTRDRMGAALVERVRRWSAASWPPAGSSRRHSRAGWQVRANGWRGSNPDWSRRYVAGWQPSTQPAAPAPPASTRFLHWPSSDADTPSPGTPTGASFDAPRNSRPELASR